MLPTLRCKLYQVSVIVFQLYWIQVCLDDFFLHDFSFIVFVCLFFGGVDIVSSVYWKSMLHGLGMGVVQLCF